MIRSVEQAARVLCNGGVGIFPTETVYGLGANAWDEKAVLRIFQLKKRPLTNPLIVHLASIDDLPLVARSVSDEAALLASTFWPGPLTLVLPKIQRLSDLVTANLDTVAVRIPSHPVARNLLRLAKIPIAAPSANRFGYLSPTDVHHAAENFAGGSGVGFTNTVAGTINDTVVGNDTCNLTTSVDFVLDGGECEIGLESTIIGWMDGHATLLRSGKITPEAILEKTGIHVAPHKKHSDNVDNRILAPGMFVRHYSPRTPLIIMARPSAHGSNTRTGLLIFTSPSAPDRDIYQAIEVLSPMGNLEEAAHNLYRSLRCLDQKQLDVIHAVLVPNTGIGVAINDRIHRAAHE